MQTFFYPEMNIKVILSLLSQTQFVLLNYVKNIHLAFIITLIDFIILRDHTYKITLFLKEKIIYLQSMTLHNYRYINYPFTN